MSKIRDTIIPLPPLSEQIRIVQKLDELMQYCNDLEASIKQSETQNEKLLQQVLREALRKEPVGV
jgi:type I restriction enzyme S subunit